MDLISPREAKSNLEVWSKLPFISRTSSQCWILKSQNPIVPLLLSSLQLHKWSYLQADWKRCIAVLHILKELPNSRGIWNDNKYYQGSYQPSVLFFWVHRMTLTDKPALWLPVHRVWSGDHNNRNTFEPHRNTFNKRLSERCLWMIASAFPCLLLSDNWCLFICKIVPLK